MPMAPIKKLQILELLRTAPDGLTTVEVAEGLGADFCGVRGRLGKLAAYGELEKLKKASLLGKVKWRLSRNRK